MKNAAWIIFKCLVCYGVTTVATNLTSKGLDKAKDWVTKKCASEN